MHSRSSKYNWILFNKPNASLSDTSTFPQLVLTMKLQNVKEVIDSSFEMITYLNSKITVK